MNQLIPARVLAGILLLAGSLASAQTFPARPITLVAPFPPGSVTDTVTRVVAQGMQESLGQPVVVDNRAGAQGTIGAAYVAQSRPDGYTLVMSSSGMFVAKSFYKSLPYDPVKGLVPVAGVGATAMMFMVPENSPVKNMADLTALAKSGEGKLTVGYGSPSGQLALAMYANTVRVNPTPVSYRGIPQALTDLAGGQIGAAVVDTGSGVAQIGSGKMRAIAVTSPARSPSAPDVPTFEESFPGIGSFETLIAVQAPAGTPPAVIDRLDKAIHAVLAKPEVKSRFASLHTYVVSLSAAELNQRINTDIPRWEGLIKRAGIEQQ